MNNEIIEIPQGDPTKVKLAYASQRVFTALIIGLIIGLLTGLYVSWKYALLVGWDATTIVWILWTAISLRDHDAQKTANLAIREDPGKTAVDTLLVLASVVSLVAVVVLLAQAGHQSGLVRLEEVGFGLLSVVLSWTVIHLIFSLRYASLYYKNRGGINFNGKQAPGFIDFAYLAFTIGMTYQTSDTNIERREIRQTILRHALLSYLFGTAIIASAINLIVSLK
jgi:uncharacterized membrane protein